VTVVTSLSVNLRRASTRGQVPPLGFRSSLGRRQASATRSVQNPHKYLDQPLVGTSSPDPRTRCADPVLYVLSAASSSSAVAAVVNLSTPKTSSPSVEPGSIPQ